MTLGKAACKLSDHGQKALHGLDWTRQRLAAPVRSAETLLPPSGRNGVHLVETARLIARHDR